MAISSPYLGVFDYWLELASGRIPGHSGVNKFGHALNGVQTTFTDLWPRADATPTQQVWLAPTAARVHAIVSSSTSDDGDPVGVGARTVRIWGLTSWSAKETYEDVTLNGTNAVNTTESYVMINRMKVTSSGATNINVGTITATAATNNTVTALIAVGEGQTQQLIYGVPSTQTAYMVDTGLSMIDATAATRIEWAIFVNEFPHLQPTIFIQKYVSHLANNGSSRVIRDWHPYFAIPGPAIVKVMAYANTADVSAAGTFDMILVDN